MEQWTPPANAASAHVSPCCAAFSAVRDNTCYSGTARRFATALHSGPTRTNWQPDLAHDRGRMSSTIPKGPLGAPQHGTKACSNAAHCDRYGIVSTNPPGTLLYQFAHPASMAGSAAKRAAAGRGRPPSSAHRPSKPFKYPAIPDSAPRQARRDQTRMCAAGDRGRRPGRPAARRRARRRAARCGRRPCARRPAGARPGCARPGSARPPPASPTAASCPATPVNIYTSIFMLRWE